MAGWFLSLWPLIVDIYCSRPFYALECCGGYRVEFVRKLKAPDVPEMQFVMTLALDCDLNRTLMTNKFFLFRWGGGL